MPGRKGMKWGQAGLTAQQRTNLEKLVLEEGFGFGTHALHAKMRDDMGDAAPTRDEISTFKRSIPSEQISLPVREIAGPLNSISPVIPPATPLARVFADTYFLPASYVARKGKRGEVFSAGILYVDALTKFVHVEPVAFLEDNRPMSSVARDGMKSFINKARQISENSDLHVEHLRTDGGSEWKGDFATYFAQEAASNLGFYSHSITTSGKASGNSIGERHIATIRRLQYAHYRYQRAYTLICVSYGKVP